MTSQDACCFSYLDGSINIWYCNTIIGAELIHHEKKYFADGSFYEIKIWRIPKRKDKPHGLKYSFTYIVNDERVIGYDNHEHKGDHKHYRGKEYIYKFQGLEKLWKDFMNDIEQFKEGNL